MKQVFATILMLYCSAATGQNLPNMQQQMPAIGVNAVADVFSHNNNILGHYSAGWYLDTWNPGGLTSYFSGFAGLKFFTLGRLAMSVHANGNVGIGTASPSAPLHAFTNSDMYGVVTGDNNNSHLRISGTAGGAAGYSLLQTFVSGSTPAGVLALQRDAGNVGIGCYDTKGYKLAVNGDVIANSIRVKLHSNWPDFVFKKDYGLQGLSDVKKYIETYQHLPDMPSASEVHAIGIDLGEINRILTKKVEELTLYLIEEHERNIKLEARINALETKSD